MLNNISVIYNQKIVRGRRYTRIIIQGKQSSPSLLFSPPKPSSPLHRLPLSTLLSSLQYQYQNCTRLNPSSFQVNLDLFFQMIRRLLDFFTLNPRSVLFSQVSFHFVQVSLDHLILYNKDKW